MEINNSKEISFFDIQMIHQQISNMPYAEIAEMIEKPLEEVIKVGKLYLKNNTHITEYIPPVIKPATAKSPVQLRQKSVKANKHKIKTSLSKKRDPKPKKQIITSVRKSGLKKTEPRFKTKDINMDELVSLRVDSRTVIYIRKNQDPIKEKAAYLKRLEKVPDPEITERRKLRLQKEAVQQRKREKHLAKFPDYYKE